jgi:hypothetical protein
VHTENAHTKELHEERESNFCIQWTERAQPNFPDKPSCTGRTGAGTMCARRLQMVEHARVEDHTRVECTRVGHSKALAYG